MAKNKFYVTTPIYYVTARPHLGSLYSTVLADVAARWQKLRGKETFMLTGTDEHGQKVAEAAAKAGKEPKAFVDSFISAYQDTWQKYGIAYDHFVRTTDPSHVKAIQGWLQKLIDSGDIYKDFYKGWYCTPCETFVTEKDIETHESFDPTTPRLRRAGKLTSGRAFTLEPVEMVKTSGKDEGPPCPSCSRATSWLSEECYFFKLSAYQDRLLQFYKDNPNLTTPKERLNEVINFVKAGLKDLSISRTTITWGIPFPGDTKHVSYVWADALNNYITAIGYGNPNKEQEFNKWWPADLHVMGKDIIRFHAIYWPAFLMASGLELPKKLLVHGWIKVDKKKMSKSLGNVVDPLVLHERYGPEPVRYYLLKQMAITHDSDFSIADLEQKIETDLANDLGNLLNRMVLLADKHGVYEVGYAEHWSSASLALRDECYNALEDYESYLEDWSFHMALARLWKFINKVNAYFHEQEPWKLAKTDKAAFLEVLSATCHSLRTIAILLWPVMPNKMEQLLDSLGVKLRLGQDTIENLELGRWGSTFMLKKILALFTKPEPLKEALRQAQDEREDMVKEIVKEAAQNQDQHITIDDVIKVELRVGQIATCEEMPKSDKLLRMQVNFGEHGQRQVLAGIKKYYAPTDLVGKKALFVFNLKPRKMMGTESQGMLLVAKSDSGKMIVVSIDDSVPSGTRLQ